MNFWRDFNIKALFCGPFFYFWQGMVRRGAFLLTLACYAGWERFCNGKAEIPL